MLVVAVGTAGAWKPPIAKAVKGYNGCFDKEGALIRQFDNGLHEKGHHVAAHLAMRRVAQCLACPCRL